MYGRPPQSMGSFGSNPLNNPYGTNYNTNDTQRQKSLQVETVTRRYPNTRIVSNDRSVLDVPVLLKNNTQLNFRVTLGPGFPAQAPVVNLLAKGEHQFLDSNSVVTHPKLRNWSQQNNLGDTLAEVFQEFIKIPPRILSYAPPVFDVQQSFQQTAPNPYNTNNMPPVQNPMGTGGYPPNNNPYGTSLPPPPITGQNQFQQPPQQQRPSPQDTRIPIPQMPAEFDEVNRLSEEEMKNLIDDNQAFKFDEFFDNLQYVKNLNSLYKDLREANLQIAKSSIEKEQQTNKKKQSLLEKQQKLQLLQAEASKKASVQSEISNRYRPENLLVILNQKIDEVEKESDAIGEQFLNQGGDVKQFMDSFLAKRALYHLRQEKKDRFKETYCN